MCTPLFFLAAFSLLPQDEGLETRAAWDRFRGPNGTGLAAGAFPLEIGPEQGIQWVTSVPPGHSSPILSRERVFLTGLDDERLVVLALERESGEVAWQREVPRPRRTKFHADNHPAAASVAVDGDTLVAFFDEFGLIAFDHDGEELWSLALGPFDNIYGMGASPILVGDAVILPCDQSGDSFVLAVGKRDGKELWRSARPQAVSGHCTPVVRRTAGGAEEILLPGSYLLDAYDVRTGARRWWLTGLPGEMKSVPVLLGDRVWVQGYNMPLNDPGNLIELVPFEQALQEDDADGDGAIGRDEFRVVRLRNAFDFLDQNSDGVFDAREWQALRISLASVNSAMSVTLGDDEGELPAESVRWRYHRGIPQLPSPLVYGGAYWMVSDGGGLVTLLDPDTGALLEKERLPDAVDAYYAAPVGGDGKVYVLSRGGILSILEAGRTVKPLWRANFDEACYGTPALEDGNIWLRTETRLYCF